MLSVYFAVLGLGLLGLGVGLIVQGPMALDRRWTRQHSNSSYADTDDSLDLHADRDLGRLEGTADALWRPVASIHFWTSAAAGFGLGGLALTAAGVTGNQAVGAAVTLGLCLGYASARTLRNLPR